MTRSPSLFATFALVCLLAVLPARVFAQNREHLQMTADIRMLQEQLGQLQLAVNQLAEQLQATNARLSQQTETTVKAIADERVLVTSVADTVNTVRAKVDENTVRVSQLTQELSAIRSGLSMVTEQLNTLVTLLQPTQPQPDAGSAPAPAENSEQTTPPAPSDGGSLSSISVPPSPGRIFDEAMSDYMSSRHDLAIQGFQEFVDRFPDAPDAPKAQFFIGQAYFNQGKFKEALDAYGKVVDKYTNTEWVGDALVAQGMCYQELGQRDNAQKIYESVRSRYPPDSSQYLQATQKLKAMGVIIE